MAPLIVGIRFQKIGKVYHFDASSCRDLKVGDFAVVDTSRGRQLGEVIQIIENPIPPPEGSWKPIFRKATPRDLVMRQLWQKKEHEARLACCAKVAELSIPGVKIVGAEYTFDGERLALLYSTEVEEKIELRELRNAMQRIYPRTHVEMRQIGPRDVAKLLGGMGACGLETRCCAAFLTDFSPISIKMAKEQDISLTPSEITGMCGRLRCCLVYEYEQYAEARKNLPKRNKPVWCPFGPGRVVDVNPLKQTVMVEFDGGIRRELSNDQLQSFEEMEASRKKAEETETHPGEIDEEAEQPVSLVNPENQTFGSFDVPMPIEPEAVPAGIPIAGGKQRPFSKGSAPDRGAYRQRGKASARSKSKPGGTGKPASGDRARSFDKASPKQGSQPPASRPGKGPSMPAKKRRKKKPL
jgi:cell fate regulator YaaT (PSP1 superfamily)